VWSRNLCPFLAETTVAKEDLTKTSEISRKGDKLFDHETCLYNQGAGHQHSKSTNQLASKAKELFVWATENHSSFLRFSLFTITLQPNIDLGFSFSIQQVKLVPPTFSFIFCTWCYVDRGLVTSYSSLKFYLFDAAWAYEQKYLAKTSHLRSTNTSNMLSCRVRHMSDTHMGHDPSTFDVFSRIHCVLVSCRIMSFWYVYVYKT